MLRLLILRRRPQPKPPEKRVVIQVWDSMDQIKAWRSSAKFKELQPLREKYGKARAFTVEGLPN
jgi:heme-degrading monooxygenase HmoA